MSEVYLDNCLFEVDSHQQVIKLLQLMQFTYVPGPAEVDNDWSGRTSGFYGRYFQKEAQKD